MSKNFDINYVCSLGPRCHTACLLKRNNLKKTSYPFDWIFTNIDMVLHCLEDDFNIFLDKTYFTIKDTASKSQQHSYYRENIDDHMFNHHNPLIVKDYNYFVRCIARFKDLLKKKENKLFVLLFLNYDKIDNNFKRKIIQLNNKFKKYVDAYGILCIVQYLGDSNKYQFSVHENIHFLEVYTTSKSNGVEFENPNDNIFLDRLIMTTYSFHLHEIEKLPRLPNEINDSITEDMETNKHTQLMEFKTGIIEEVMEEVMEELKTEMKKDIKSLKTVLLEELKTVIWEELKPILFEELKTKLLEELNFEFIMKDHGTNTSSNDLTPEFFEITDPELTPDDETEPELFETNDAELIPDDISYYIQSDDETEPELFETNDAELIPDDISYYIQSDDETEPELFEINDAELIPDDISYYIKSDDETETEPLEVTEVS